VSESIAQAPAGHRNHRRLRALAGLVVGIGILVALVKLRSQARGSEGILSSLRAASPAVVGLAAVLEAGSYVLAGLELSRLCPALRRWTAMRVAVGSLGVGPLLPGNPLTASGIAYGELRRARRPGGQALAASTAIVFAIPILSMLAIAGPALIASGAFAPLPAGWRGVVLACGLTALGLAGLSAAALAGRIRGRWPSRVRELLGGGRQAGMLVGLGVGAWVCDAGCLWLTGRALGTHLPLASLPMAYIAGVAIMSLPVLPGGLGAVEVSVPAVFAAGGASYPSAVVAVLAWRVFSFWIPTLAGGLSLASLHRRRPQAAA
jgi:putative heme transporter